MTSFQWGNPPADLGALPRMALSFYHTHAGPWLTQKQPTCRAATPLLPSPDAPWKWYPLASECLHTHLSTFEKIPFTALKYKPTWEAEGLILQGLCHFCEVLLVLNFLQSKWKHPWTHASQAACLPSRTNDCTVQGGEREPKHDPVSLCPSSQVFVSLRTIHKTVVLHLKKILLKAKL